MQRLLLILALSVTIYGCKPEPKTAQLPASEQVAEQDRDSVPFLWEAANIYFLLTDRFRNGEPENDLNFDRVNPTGPLRGFMGGDLAGITEKIEDGYFTDLGINAIWFTPVVEQVHGDTDEGTGNTYAYHGYWAKDWTALDPNFGTREELEKLVATAHGKGIRILMDVVLNHTGPVTGEDPAWPESWVRLDPTCNFEDYQGTTACTLVENLPDIRTESTEAVVLPDALLAKWKAEGRLSEELDELQVFFDRTGYPRAPRYYIIKWLTDYVNDLGIDGFRVDTAKHVNEDAWAELYREAAYAFQNWKRKNPGKVLDDTPFFMVGEVYGYGASSGRDYDFGDRKVDYFDHGFQSLINFELKSDAGQSYDRVFEKYSTLLHGELDGLGIVNYLSSHDDGSPFDPERSKSFQSANILLLTPGASQVYYGDESGRGLVVEGTVGDATLRSFMNWEELDSLPEKQEVLAHWQKLGRFRNQHPAIGAGRHKRLSSRPYVFSRTYTDGDYRDKVVVGLDLPEGRKSLYVRGFFGDGTVLRDAYSDSEATVSGGRVELDTPYPVALLEPAE